MHSLESKFQVEGHSKNIFSHVELKQLKTCLYQLNGIVYSFTLIYGGGLHVRYQIGYLMSRYQKEPDIKGAGTLCKIQKVGPHVRCPTRLID